MSEFGVSNHSSDLYRRVENLERLVNEIIHTLKKVKQESTKALIVAKDEDNYKVELLDEGIIVDAILSNDISYWIVNGVPEIGDNVKVSMSNQIFKVVIQERITKLDYKEQTQNNNKIQRMKAKQ